MASQSISYYHQWSPNMEH